ncbi:MAG: DUF1501 domain-containing protein [Proteobacteria bacterium]|nr:DUF1501 domain-containing protein [Pseudomonadota bacterium]
MQRRGFLAGVSGLAVSGLLPGCANQAPVAGAANAYRPAPTVARSGGYPGPVGRRILVLVELQGGNDGLNMVIPYADPLYRRLRPGLAIETAEIKTVAAEQGFHPSFDPLLAPFENGELLVVNSVGYPRPNRSHFRSIEIWEQATASDQYGSEGWITHALSEHPVLGKRAADADGIVVGTGNIGPLAGPATRLVNMREPRQFLAQSEAMNPLAARKDVSDALRHLVRTQNEAVSAADAVRRKLSGGDRFARRFAGDPFARSLSVAANLIADGVDVPVWKLTLGSFDTHADQRQRHARLLANLAGGLAAFRAAMKDIGRWNDTLVVTYSEFGRRVGENLSRGTDHGTAAPLLALGGSVQGGFVGPVPDLEDLDAGDLKAKIDFRQVYAGIVADWWSQPDNFLVRQGHRPVPFIRQALVSAGAAQQIPL